MNTGKGKNDQRIGRWTMNRKKRVVGLIHSSAQIDHLCFVKEMFCAISKDVFGILVSL